MKEKNLIVFGIVIFLLVSLSPIFMSLASKTDMPVINLDELKKAHKTCVLPAEEMKREHMVILNDWRNTVVREGNRIYVTPDGTEFNMSLSTGETSCLGCHGDKADFCDKCHNYASVKPYCWDCHTEPKNTIKVAETEDEEDGDDEEEGHEEEASDEE